jgi:ribosomal protein S18 acetylase RimI-like enzyme
MQEDSIALPSGYTARATQLEDAEAVARVYEEASRTRGDNEVNDPDALREDWAAPGFDLQKSSRVVLNAAGEIVGMITVWDYTPPPVHPFVSWDVLPLPERPQIARALLAWGEERAKEATPRCPENVRVSYKTATLAGYAADEQLLTDMGLTPLRYFNRMLINMTETPAPVTFPPGFTVRTLNHPEEFETLIRAREEAWRDHYGYVERPIEEVYKSWHHWIESDKLFDPTLWFVALDDASGEIAGMVLGRMEDWEDPTVGYVNIVAVRPAWRKRGLAAALLQHAFGALWQRGRQSVSLFVDSSSPTGAGRLYERAGMHISRQYVHYEKELRPGIELANHANGEN